MWASCLFSFHTYKGLGHLNFCYHSWTAVTYLLLFFSLIGGDVLDSIGTLFMSVCVRPNSHSAGSVTVIYFTTHCYPCHGLFSCMKPLCLFHSVNDDTKLTLSVLSIFEIEK